MNPLRVPCRAFHEGCFPPILLLAALAAGPLPCGCAKKTAENTDIKSLEEECQGISDQIRNNRYESGPRETGDTWTRFELRAETASFKLIRTVHATEPYHLQIVVNYKMRTIRAPLATESQARAAEFDLTLDFPVIYDLIRQDDKWYLNRVTSKAIKASPLSRSTIEGLLAGSVRRML